MKFKAMQTRAGLAGLADEILDVLEGLNKNQGKTVIMVTHSPQAAARAGIVLKLNEGMLVS